MSLIENKNKRIRAVSAKESSARPLSGKGRNVQRTQFIETVYGGPQPPRKIQNIGLKTDHDFVKLLPKKPTKDRQQLFQQNLHLRQQINKLTDQLSKQRGQIYTLQKKNKKFTKQINIQFEKQMYWTGSNSHQIAGIKQQYQKLKTKYQLKCKQCDIAKKQSTYLQIQEYKIYLENLQLDNKHLQDKLLKLYNNSSQQYSLGNQTNKQASQFIMMELQQKKQKIQNKYMELQTRLKSATQGIKDRDKKIMFLQKLIIEKDNSQHHSYKKSKKLQKQKQGLLQQLQLIKQQLKLTKQTFNYKINQIQQNNQKKYQLEKQLFDRTLQQRQKKIEKLQKQVSYLSTLLTYWKPLDQINKHNVDKIVDQHHKEQHTNSMSKSIKIGKNQSSISMINRNRRQSNQQPISNQPRQEARNLSIIQSQVKQRVQRTANQKRSQQAQKKRKVPFEDVQDIGALLRYRFICQNLEIEQIKKYFQCFKQQHQFLNEETQSEIQWETNYINMKQVYGILTNQIFRLNEDDAFLLSRYIIEDSNQEHVYCDWENQIQRSIAKSIIKTVVNEYQIFDENVLNSVEFQCNDMIQKYQTNLHSALKAVASSGFVSNRKLLELIHSLGIEISQNCKQLLIGKLAMNSDSLNKLKYSILF